MHGFYRLNAELRVKATKCGFLIFYFLASKDKVLQMVPANNRESSKSFLVLVPNL
jgi:hypothetical protein